MKKLLIIPIIVSLLSSCSGLFGDLFPPEEDDADAFVGTWNLSMVESVVWGAASGTLTDTGTLFISKLSANRVQTNGFFKTQGEVVGNTVYFEATHTSDTEGYLDTVFGPATLNGNVITLTSNQTGKLRSNGVLYPTRSSAQITLIRQRQ